MSACDPQTFSNISQGTWDSFLEKAAQFGINLSGNSGQGGQQGFTFSWNYNPQAQTLTIQCLDHPFFAPCSMINEKISELIKQNS